MMLALLADESLKCPPLECIFTVDEEVGLLGAEGLDLSSLNSRRMINLDSEDEGRGLANKDLAKFADQLTSLCDKWQ